MTKSRRGRPSAKYVQFTEEANALDYLQRAADATRLVERDQLAWKWLVIALHGALYGLAVCALKGSDWTRVVTAAGRLISFREAMRRCQQDAEMDLFTHSTKLELTTEERRSITHLHRVQLQLVRYVPKRWKVELHGLAVSSIDGFGVITKLVETRNVRLTRAQQRDIEAIVRGSVKRLTGTQLYKDHVAATRRLAGK